MMHPSQSVMAVRLRKHRQTARMLLACTFLLTLASAFLTHSARFSSQSSTQTYTSNPNCLGSKVGSRRGRGGPRKYETPRRLGSQDGVAPSGIKPASGVRKKSISPKIERIHLTTRGVGSLLGLTPPGTANAMGSGNGNRDAVDLWGTEQIRNHLSFQPKNRSFIEPDSAEASTSKRKSDWFTKIPKNHVIPSVDLVNIFNLPRDFHKHYEVAKDGILGEGAYGTVFAAIHKKTQQKVAVKVLYKRVHKKKQRPADARYMCRLKNELQMMQEMGRGEHAVEFMEAFEDGNNLYLVMEMCNGPTVKQCIRQRNLTENHARTIMSQVVEMLATWHEDGYMHCDIKPANLLLEKDDFDDIRVKATDFGLAHKFAPGTIHHKKQGTKVYMAPEMLRKRYDEKADLWSAGVIAYQLLTGHLPFCRQDSEIRRMPTEDLEDRIRNYPIDVESTPPWNKISAEARSFVLAILERDPNKRPSARSLVEHPWFTRMEQLDCSENERNIKRGKIGQNGGGRGEQEKAVFT